MTLPSLRYFISAMSNLFFIDMLKFVLYRHALRFKTRETEAQLHVSIKDIQFI